MNYLSNAIIILSVSFLFGCTQPKQIVKEVEPVEVKIPVPSCVILSTPPKPLLNVLKVTDTTSQEELVKYYAADLKTLIWYSNSLERIIETSNSECVKIKSQTIR